MPKAIDHDQRRREIIDATWGLIVKGGLEAATMREIASEAGFANGALKHYFPGKDEIIEGAYRRALEWTSARISAAMAGKSGIDAFKALVYGAMPLDAESHQAVRVLLSFWEAGLRNDAFRAEYQEHIDAWRGLLGSLIQDCRAEGTIRVKTSDDDLAAEIITMCIGATVLAVISPQFATPERLTDQLDGFFGRIETS